MTVSDTNYHHRTYRTYQSVPGRAALPPSKSLYPSVRTGRELPGTVAMTQSKEKRSDPGFFESLGKMVDETARDISQKANGYASKVQEQKWRDKAQLYWESVGSKVDESSRKWTDNAAHYRDKYQKWVEDERQGRALCLMSGERYLDCMEAEGESSCARKKELFRQQCNAWKQVSSYSSLFTEEEKKK